MQTRSTRRTLLIHGLLLGFLAPGAVAESRQARQRHCKKIKKRIAGIESRLRQGHSARTGRRYREKLRALELERYRRCR